MNQKSLKILQRDYYKELYTQSSASNKNDIKTLLDSLQLPPIGTMQNECITAMITTDEIQKAIGKLKTSGFHLSGIKRTVPSTPHYL